MKKHIKKAFDDFVEDIIKDAAAPAKHYLFEVRDNANKLCEDRADNFHSVVALLLCISLRCHLDIQTVVEFLMTRVSNPDIDDWNILGSLAVFERYNEFGVDYWSQQSGIDEGMGGRFVRSPC